MNIESALEALQHDLAFIDLMSRGSSGRLELLVMELQDIKLKMYQEQGHALPHIHIDYGRKAHVASYSINEGKRLIGTLDKKYDKKIGVWIEENKEVLIELWNALKNGNKTEHLIAQISANVS